MSGPVVFVKDDAPDWNHCKTLEDSIVAIRRNQGTQSHEYQALESFYGKQRLEEIWERYLAKQAGKGGS